MGPMGHKLILIDQCGAVVYAIDRIEDYFRNPTKDEEERGFKPPHRDELMSKIAHGMAVAYGLDIAPTTPFSKLETVVSRSQS